MFLKIKKILLSENFFVACVILLGLTLSLQPMFYELFRRGDIFPDRQFVLVYNFAPDYNAYLSKIIQGIQGRFDVVEYFTSEKHNPSYIQIFYLWVGRIGAVFSSNPEVAYHLARIGFGAGWVLVGWQFIKFSFTSKLNRKLALLLFVFAGNFPHYVPDQAGYGFSFLGSKWDQTLVGWSNLDPVRRLTFIPHWNAGHTFGLAALLLLIKSICTDFKTNKVTKIVSLFLAVTLGIFCGLTLPSMLVGVYAIMGLWFIYQIILNWKNVFTNAPEYVLVNLNWLIPFVIFFLLTFTTLGYNFWVTSFYPWKALVETDLYVNKTVFPYLTYFIALGPVGFLGLAGAILALLFKKEKLVWSAVWVLGMLTLIFVFDKLINWHDQTRFLEVGPELPLSILTVFALGIIGSIFKRFKIYFVIFCVGLILLLSVFLFSISIKAQDEFINHKIKGTYPPMSFGNFVVYPVKSAMEAINYLKNNVKDDEVILSGYTMGNHIAAYAGRYVYNGHGSQTVHFYQEKQPKMISFYQGKMNEQEKREFFKNNRIKYIVYGPEEKTLGENQMLNENYLEVFRNSDVIIYKIKE